MQIKSDLDVKERGLKLAHVGRNGGADVTSLGILRRWRNDENTSDKSSLCIERTT